jgi:hypothetical protein
VDCGEAIAKFVAVNCDNLQLAERLHLLCSPREAGKNRCQSVWLNVLSDKDLIDNLRSCDNFTSAQCPTGCAGAIIAVVLKMGCCFRTIYNHTKFLDIFVKYKLLTSEQKVTIQNTLQPILWRACNVPLTAICTGDSFPGESVLATGVCTVEKIETFTLGLTPTCSHFYGLLSTASEEKLDIVCQECPENETCNDPLSAKLRILSCMHTDRDGKLGKSCSHCLREKLKNNTVFADLRATCFGGENAIANISNCPIGCQEALKELKAQLGCCYQSIFNETTLLDAFLYKEHITPSKREFFEKLSMPELWEICDVSLQTRCTEDSISTAAMALQHTTVVATAEVHHHTTVVASNTGSSSLSSSKAAAAPHHAIAEAVVATNMTAAAVVLQHTATASFITVMCGILIPYLL